MSFIDKITLRNFKAFNEVTEIDIKGNHLLMYGENGSGKSSIYWALYTMLQSANKKEADIVKYFTPNNPENLINYNFLSNLPSFSIDANGNINNPQSIGLNAYLEVLFTTKERLIINSQGISCFTWDDDEEKYIEDNEYGRTLLDNLNRSSDFISHRLLINFYNFRNSKEINLWEVFVRDIFPFLQIGLGAGNNSLGNILSDILTNKPFYDFSGNTFKLRRSNHWSRIQYEEKIENFNKELDDWINEINPMVNDFYNNYFKENNENEIKIILDYDKKLSFDNVTQNAKEGNNTFYLWAKYHVDLNNPSIKFTIKTKDGNGNWIVVARPQSFFNEAKLTQIALSVRFAFTLQRIGLYDGQILALDDLLVSLDMSNRDKVLNIILDLFAKNYKIYLFTHEKNFFDFCLYKILQYNDKANWDIKEIYEPNDLSSKPTIISSEYSYFEKAEKYFKAKDFVATSLYLRKDFEKTVKERLPKEYARTVDGEYHNLAHYWKLFREHYKNLKIDMDIVSPTMNTYFEQSKTFILNKQAHHNLSVPVYTHELKKVFSILSEIKNTYPIPETKIILSKGMSLKFSHSAQNYSMEFELLDDLRIDKIGVNSSINIPDCNILTWQFNSVEFWDFAKGKQLANKPKSTKNKLDFIRDNLVANVFVPLSITDEMFLNNTFIVDGIWSLKELLDKSGISI